MWRKRSGVILGKILKKRNRIRKFVNNHKTKIYHTKLDHWHMMSKEIIQAMQELSPIYQELNDDFQTIDVVDLIYYERWLNG